MGLDEARPDAVAKRRARHRRTAQNVDDLVDDGSFVEYGPVVIAGQRRRRELADLIANTPADGLVGGIASPRPMATIVLRKFVPAPTHAAGSAPCSTPPATRRRTRGKKRPNVDTW